MSWCLPRTLPPVPQASYDTRHFALGASRMTLPACRTYLPPEWAPQSGVMLTWPHSQSDWAPILHKVEPVFTAIAASIARFETVLIACHDEAVRAQVAAQLRSAGIPKERLHLLVAPANDTWARDHGPITVLCRNSADSAQLRLQRLGRKVRTRPRQSHHPPAVCIGRVRGCPARNRGSDSRRWLDRSGRPGHATHDHELPARANAQPGPHACTDRSQNSPSFLVSRVSCGWKAAIWPATIPTATSTPSHACATQTPSPTSPVMTRPTSITVALQAMEKELQAFRTAAGQPYRLGGTTLATRQI